jgi:hypothetical protein
MLHTTHPHSISGSIPVVPRDDYFTAFFGAHHPLPRHCLRTRACFRFMRRSSRRRARSLEEDEWKDVTQLLQVPVACLLQALSCDLTLIEQCARASNVVASLTHCRRCLICPFNGLLPSGGGG